MKKLPIGIQTFIEIIEEQYLYVDKTGLAVDLVESGKTISSPALYFSAVIDTKLKH